jgi:hypothetical protein
MCGDGVIWAGHEDCEPPNTSSCNSTCHFIAN